MILKKYNIVKYLLLLIIIVILTFIIKEDIGIGLHTKRSYKEYCISNTEFYEESTVSRFIENNENNYKTGYIFIGDSRFIGMDDVCNISETDNKFVIAKVSEGYDFLINTALPEAERITQSNNDITNWKYIICLGVNDLYNLDKYINTYNDLSNTIDLIVISVNPIEYHNNISNEAIEEFNSKLENIEGIQYVDSYSILLNNGFNTTDGIHYTDRTYELIYNIINNAIKEDTKQYE